jgi:hypothetical protein
LSLIPCAEIGGRMVEGYRKLTPPSTSRIRCGFWLSPTRRSPRGAWNLVRDGRGLECCSASARWVRRMCSRAPPRMRKSEPSSRRLVPWPTGRVPGSGGPPLLEASAGLGVADSESGRGYGSAGGSGVRVREATTPRIGRRELRRFAPCCVAQPKASANSSHKHSRGHPRRWTGQIQPGPDRVNPHDPPNWYWTLNILSEGRAATARHVRVFGELGERDILSGMGRTRTHIDQTTGPIQPMGCPGSRSGITELLRLP